MKTLKEHMLIAKAGRRLSPKITIAGYTFKLAPDHGRNPGAIYVTYSLTGDYLGMVKDNRFSCINQKHFHAVTSILDNPQEAVEVHGQQTGNCCICGRTLFNKDSIAAMIGPICAEKWGFSISSTETPDASVEF